MHKNPSKYFLIIISVLQFIISNKFVLAQIPKEEYIFRQIKIEDGLSQSSVFTVIQDKKGFLWFGTANGLNRYDGYSFKVFTNDPADSSSISNNGISSLFEDKEGDIWIGTFEGMLNKFNRTKGTFTHFNIPEYTRAVANPEEKYYSFPLPFSRNNNNTITSIAQDEKGILWIGTWGKGLIKFDLKKNKFEYYHHTPGSLDGFGSNRIRAILPDKEGVLWVGTLGDGLYKFLTDETNKKIIKYKSSNNEWCISDNRILSLLKDKKGDLWIGTFNGGLDRLSHRNQLTSPQDARFEKFLHRQKDNNSLSNNFVTSIIQDKNGSLWAGTFGGGINRFIPLSKSFEAFKNDVNDPNSLSKNDVLTIFEDKSGSIWVGTHLGKGLNKLEHNIVKFGLINKDIQNHEGLDDDVVWAVSEDKNSNLWIGTLSGGLNKLDRKSGKFYYYKNNPHDPNSISDNHVRAILDDQKGNLWIGTYNGGLNKFNKATLNFTRFKNLFPDSTELNTNQVQAILIDKDKNLWVGSFGGGLYRFEGDNPSAGSAYKRFIHDANDPFSLSDNRIYSMTEDREGIIWVGTYNGGLNRFEKKSGKFISYKNIPGDETSLTDNRVMCIYEDPFGFLWIGTYGGGLQKFDKRTEKFIRYDKKDKMNSSVVYGILEDSKRNLWMSTDNGLYKFNLQTEHFTQYDLHDGLQSLEYSGGAYFKSAHGEMFFGGINGLNYFVPDSIKDDSYIPPVVISSVRIFNQPVQGEKDTLELTYSQNFFSFEFASLDFSNPEDNQYAYMLEGFDIDWHYVDSRRRIANYTNLSPGDYIFSVRGSNSDGVWNNDGAKIFLRILPPLWKRWWFLSFSGLLTAFLIFYLSTLRYRGLLAIERLKSKLAADLHDNVGSGLTEISILSELASYEASNYSYNSAKKLTTISEKARQLIDNMSDIVWMVNPQRDSFYHLILRLKDTYSDLLQSSDISFKTTNLEKLSPLKLPMEYKQNLYLLFKEGINNSIKHAKCKRIGLEASLNKDILELELKDDGAGFDPQTVNFGNGISNMKSRAKAIGGEISINSTTEGTSIKFVGKVGSLKKYFLSFKGS